MASDQLFCDHNPFHLHHKCLQIILIYILKPLCIYVIKPPFNQFNPTFCLNFLSHFHSILFCKILKLPYLTLVGMTTRGKVQRPSARSALQTARPRNRENISHLPLITLQVKIHATPGHFMLTCTAGGKLSPFLFLVVYIIIISVITI